MNAQNDTQSEQTPPAGGGGPVVAIVLGVIIIIGAVVLVMTLGQGDGPADDAKAPAHTHDDDASHDGHDHGDDDAAHEDDADAEVEAPAPKPEPKPEAKPEPAPAPEAANEDPAKVDSPIGRARNYANTTAPGISEGVAVLEVELPNPAFAGTPKDTPAGARMAKLTGKDRGPYMLPEELAGQVENVALDMQVTSSDPAPLIGDLDLVTDGDKEPLDGRWVELAPGLQWLQIDLEQEVEALAIFLWHNHMETRIYKDVVIRVSNDPEFVEYTEVFNNDFDNSAGLGKGLDYEYFENYEGLLVPLYDPKTKKGVKFQYVRAYSKGSTSDDANHYTELEVFAKTQ